MPVGYSSSLDGLIYHRVDRYTYVEFHAGIQMRVASSADTTGLRRPDHVCVEYLNVKMEGGRVQAPTISPPERFIHPSPASEFSFQSFRPR